MQKVEIHVSDIRTYWKCKMAWDFQSPLRRNLEPSRLYAPFVTGRAIHYALEQYYRGARSMRNALADFIAAEEPKVDELDTSLFNEQMDLASAMIEHYGLWIKNGPLTEWSDDKFIFLKWEHEWSLPLITPTGRVSPNIYLGGRFDGLVRRKDDSTLWLWETKTSRSCKELADTLWNDIQATVYTWAATTMYKEPVAGVIYNIMRKKAPVAPRILKDGTLSKATNIDTSPEFYKRMVLEHHDGDLAGLVGYEDFLYELTHDLDRKPYFLRFPVRRSPVELRQAMSDIYHTCVEMAYQHTRVYPQPSWMNCRFCSFKDPCAAYMRNEPAEVQQLLEDEFRPHTSYNPNLPEVEMEM